MKAQTRPAGAESEPWMIAIYNTDFSCARQQAPRFELHRLTGQIVMGIQPGGAGGWPSIESGVLETGHSPKPSTDISPIMASTGGDETV